MGDPFRQALVTAPLSLGAQRSVRMMPAIGREMGGGWNLPNFPNFPGIRNGRRFAVSPSPVLTDSPTSRLAVSPTYDSRLTTHDSRLINHARQATRRPTREWRRSRP